MKWNNLFQNICDLINCQGPSDVNSIQQKIDLLPLANKGTTNGKNVCDHLFGRLTTTSNNKEIHKKNILHRTVYVCSLAFDMKVFHREHNFPIKETLMDGSGEIVTMCRRHRRHSRFFHIAPQPVVVTEMEPADAQRCGNWGSGFCRTIIGDPGVIVLIFLLALLCSLSAGGFFGTSKSEMSRWAINWLAWLGLP